jgi:hypothetical protein
MQKEDNLLELLATALQKEKEKKVNCIECLKNHLMQKPFGEGSPATAQKPMHSRPHADTI